MSDLEMASVHLSRPEDRERFLWNGNTVFDLVLAGQHTAGSLALLDQRGCRGDTTPMHLHRTDAEIFYVIEGQMRAWVGDDVHALDAGGALYLPPKQAHAIGVVSERARVITITTPAGFGDFVAAAGLPVRGDAPSRWEFDVARLMEEAPVYGIDIIGPPPALG